MIRKIFLIKPHNKKGRSWQEGSCQNKNKKTGNWGVKVTSKKASPTPVEELKCNHILLAMVYEAPYHYLQYQFHLQVYRSYQLVQVYQLALAKSKTENQQYPCPTNNSQHLAQCISPSLCTTCTNGEKNKYNVVRTIMKGNEKKSFSKSSPKGPRTEWLWWPRGPRQIILDYLQCIETIISS